MSKRKAKKRPATSRSVPFKCEHCGAPIAVTLHGTEATPSRVDCPNCGTRDGATPAP